jgi:hypothetical protein
MTTNSDATSDATWDEIENYNWTVTRNATMSALNLEMYKL